MKRLNLLIVIFLVIAVIACKEKDVLPPDDVQEFVFLPDTALSMNEFDNSTEGNELHIHAEMLTFAPRDVDVVLEVTVEGVNATEGVDFEIVSSSKTIIIPAGKFKSETGLMLRTINNSIPNEDRTVKVTLTSSSDAKLKIGKGINAPTHTVTTISISDDECTDDISIFNNAEWTFLALDSYETAYDGTFMTKISGDNMTIIGDIMNYDLGISMDVKLTPDPSAPTKGTIAFVSSTTGNDGSWDYRWKMDQEGFYDVCGRSMTIPVAIEFFDFDGSYGALNEWVEWYSTVVNATVTTIGGSGPTAPSGSVTTPINVIAGSEVLFEGSFTDDEGLTEITLVNSGLALNETITLSGETNYSMSHTYSVPGGAAAGAYDVVVTVKNSVSLSSEFSITVDVSEPCNDNYNVFHNATISGIASSGYYSDDYAVSYTGILAGDMLTLTGALNDYIGDELTVQMVSDVSDNTFGTIEFSVEDIPDNGDGYTYRIIPTAGQVSSYNACSGKMDIYYDLEYADGYGGWTYWFSNHLNLTKE